jgi:hypothetical protein
MGIVINVGSDSVRLFAQAKCHMPVQKKTGYLFTLNV